MKFKEAIGLFILGIAIGVCFTLWGYAIKESADKTEGEVASVKWKTDHFKLNESNLYDELIAQGVQFPEIVQAQAVLETGYFKSYACKTQNNLFGLRKSDGTYMSFEHWTDAVAAYKKYIQKWKVPPNNYYQYLDSLGYAEDKTYTTKLKQLVNPQ